MKKLVRFNSLTLFSLALAVLLTGCGIQNNRPGEANMPDDWFIGQTLYEVYLRAYSDPGTIAGLTADLDRLHDLGVTTLWLMPIHPVGIEGRKGSAGSPYSVRDYFAVGDEYGSLDDLRELVNQAHARNMKVILDEVMNHSANDYPLMEEHPDWWMRDEEGNFSREVEDWSDISDWNHDNPEARQYLTDVLIYWIEEANIDGYRCDVAGMVPPEFWSAAIQQIREIKPNAFMLAEWEDPWILSVGFDAAYDWNLYHRMKDHVQGEITLDSLWAAVEQKHEIYPPGKQPMRFIENHDEPRAAEAFGWPEVQSYAALIFTLPGIPLLYTGQEIGEEHKPSLFENEPVDWDEGDPRYKELYTDLVELRNRFSALQRGSTVRLPIGEPQVLLFTRIHEDERLLVAINFSDENVIVDRPVSLGGGDYTDVTDSADMGEEFSVPPHGYRIFSLQ